MDLKDAIHARHSVRAYQNRVVEPGKLEQVLALATLAPSASNLQAYQIYVVRNQATKEALSLAARGQGFIATAPIILAFCADLTRAHEFGHVLEQNYSPQDTIIAMAYAQLAATDQGLDSCWVGAFDEAPAARALSLPETQRLIGLLPLGYAATAAQPVAHRPVSDLVVDQGQ
jgi:nitroreductase